MGNSIDRTTLGSDTTNTNQALLHFGESVFRASSNTLGRPKLPTKAIIIFIENFARPRRALQQGTGIFSISGITYSALRTTCPKQKKIVYKLQLDTRCLTTRAHYYTTDSSTINSRIRTPSEVIMRERSVSGQSAVGQASCRAGGADVDLRSIFGRPYVTLRDLKLRSRGVTTAGNSAGATGCGVR